MADGLHQQHLGLLHRIQRCFIGMLDYSLIAAVAAVVREGSFERAALALHVTPSAVSQRVKLLEQRLGERLIVRGSPCRATAAGAHLVQHADAVQALEQQLVRALPAAQLSGGGGPTPRPTLRVAVNADSLATWFMAAAAEFTREHAALLDLRLDDQEHTAAALRAGDVAAAVTTLAAPVPGCRSLALGAMHYVAVASPAYVSRHFSDGVDAVSLAAAPCLVFNQKDRLQDDWVRAAVGRKVPLPRHWVPAAQAFIDGCLAGLGWGMNPASLAVPHIARGALVELPPGLRLPVSLHWQVPRNATGLLQALTLAVSRAASVLRS
jgi:LysR family transcriptional regulator (chromosome initiation inhibitor)